MNRSKRKSNANVASSPLTKKSRKSVAATKKEAPADLAIASPDLAIASGEMRVPRLGLCCQFLSEKIKFRTTTVKAMSQLELSQGREKLGTLCLANVLALRQAVEYCAKNGVGCFRVTSGILPLKTHPEQGYKVSDLPNGEAILAGFRDIKPLAAKHGIRLVFHPDQFNVLNSPREDVVCSSVKELDYQAEVSEWIGADVLNVHGGGVYGNKTEALERLKTQILLLPERVRSRLTLENDDKSYTPSDLLPVCRATGVPLVYDVHHHRCNRDELTEEEATLAAIATWGSKEPLFHVSSPKEGWEGPNPARHHDYISFQDFPTHWLSLAQRVTVSLGLRLSSVDSRAGRPLTPPHTATPCLPPHSSSQHTLKQPLSLSL
mmetsp:Transcript_11197/g.25434  ORF Transcript_11197/g.25434 Transcript_11197/m.25434 type:complete len:377 (-) Transcript_11197:44-1174(-)